MEEHVIIGDTIEFDSDMDTEFSMSLLPLDIFDNWERAGTLSDFIADYFGTFYDSEGAHNIISTIFNELIENAVKFTKNNSQPIHIVIKKSGNNLLSKITNTIPRHRKTSFSGICKDLFTNDLDELFLKRIEEGVADSRKSGIGLILLRKDYHIDTCFDFFKDSDSVDKIAVTFKLAIK